MAWCCEYFLIALGVDATMIVPAEKKLCVLDMNGLLMETFHWAKKMSQRATS